MIPMRKFGRAISNCDPKAKLNVSQLMPILGQLDSEWTSNHVLDANEQHSMLEHQWKMFGTCALTLLKSESKYFATALELHSKLDIYDALYSNGILPGQEVLTHTIMEAIEKHLTPAVKPAFKCLKLKGYSLPVLISLSICLSTSLEPIDCQTVIHKSDLYGDCPTNDPVLYMHHSQMVPLKLISKICHLVIMMVFLMAFSILVCSIHLLCYLWIYCGDASHLGHCQGHQRVEKEIQK